jgi:dihydropteroate synthase
MYRVVAQSGLHYIAMHWRGFSTDMDKLAQYDDVVTDVRSELKQRLAEMIVWGIDPQKVILDPGLGFAKTAEHNWQLLAKLDEFVALGHRVLIGASRKRFLQPFGAEPVERDDATAIISALADRAGVWGVRVHDVPTTRRALRIADAMTTGVLQ